MKGKAHHNSVKSKKHSSVPQEVFKSSAMKAFKSNPITDKKQ
jgi:hypothetical protein